VIRDPRQRLAAACAAAALRLAICDSRLRLRLRFAAADSAALAKRWTSVASFGPCVRAVP
jgi:hypothetical protein